jgi:asparagine synthase (glutamine-hydrolysing)
MCAIAGVVGSKDPQVGVTAVEKMLSILARRGPDGEGVKSWEGVTFGHRRLAIFDLSAAGSQPMVTPDEAVGVVFNGAIYNYRELRDELRLNGYSFRSSTDTEVLLHGYLEWGLDRLVGRLRGMFAFALWDDRVRKLYLVRDRLGVKPLVYAATQQALAFASTVRGLLVAGYSGDLDEEAVDYFLDFGFLPDDQSIYRGVRKVPAGSIVEWSHGDMCIRRYWTRPSQPTLANISFRDAVDETRRLLLDAVKIRLHADVQVGALLSSGIDSSLVCWAVGTLGGEIRAYTVAAPGDPWDETPAAKETASRLRLDHCVVEMSDDDAPEIEDLVSAYAEPFGSASALGMLRVSRAVSRSSPVKVLLTGDGGDDVFLGYPRHRKFWIAGKLSQHLPPVAMRLWRTSGSWFPRVGPFRRAAALLEYTEHGVGGVIKYSQDRQRSETDDLAGERLRGRCVTPRSTLWSPQAGHRVLSDFLEYEFNTRFLGEYMTKVDGATMHYGIEARSPFLDQSLWEFASSVPFGIRLHRGRLKAVLRQLVREEVGQAVARRPKRGFGVPVQRWIVRRWRPWVEELLRESVLENEGWIRRGSALKGLATAVDSGIAPIQLWHVVVLEAWIRHERRIGI